MRPLEHLSLLSHTLTSPLPAIEAVTSLVTASRVTLVAVAQLPVITLAAPLNFRMGMTQCPFLVQIFEALLPV